MIPKRIHYCWFGPNPLPIETQRYIESWRRILPDYELKLWNEDNFDINDHAYAKAAYAAEKYAFVADVCRIQALCMEGGLYLDTDVQVLHSFDALLNQCCFTGFEQGFNPYTREITCNPQAGVMGCEAGNGFMQAVAQRYQNLTFDPRQLVTINMVFRQLYEEYGIRFDNTLQTIPNVLTVYPSDYFMAKNAYTHELNITPHTVCIHHYDGTWLADGKHKNAAKRRLLTLLRNGLGARRSQQLITWLKRHRRP